MNNCLAVTSDGFFALPQANPIKDYDNQTTRNEYSVGIQSGSIKVRTVATSLAPQFAFPFGKNDRPRTTSNEYLDLSDPFIQHLKRLSELKDRRAWPADSEAPSLLAFSFASFVMHGLKKHELPPSSIVASAEGGIAFCFVKGNKYADIECLNTGEILGVTTNRRDRPSVWEINFSQSEISRAVERIRAFLS